MVLCGRRTDYASALSRPGLTGLRGIRLGHTDGGEKRHFSLCWPAVAMRSAIPKAGTPIAAPEVASKVFVGPGAARSGRHAMAKAAGSIGLPFNAQAYLDPSHIRPIDQNRPTPI